MSLPPADKNQEKISLNDLRGDDKVFESFFKENFVPLCSYCQFKFGFDLDLAKETVHTAFIKLWEIRSTLNNEVPVKTYLQKMVTNKALDILRHEKVKTGYIKLTGGKEEEIASANSFESIDFKELLQQINSAIEDMPEQMRTVFGLSRFEGLKYSEIAARLNISPKTVETQMGRALAKLRQRLSGYLTTCIIIILFILWSI